MEVLTKDEFIHLVDINNLFLEMEKQADWGKSELLKQIYDEMLKLPRAVISVERAT